MPRNKKIKKDKTNTPSLSSNEQFSKKIEIKPEDNPEQITKKVFDAISQLELQRGMDKWLKEQKKDDLITHRDMGILKTLITEYLDVFLIMGYTPHGERIILQNFKNARDRDAIMEFFKTVFIKQQQENFLDEE